MKQEKFPCFKSERILFSDVCLVFLTTARFDDKQTHFCTVLTTASTTIAELLDIIPTLCKNQTEARKEGKLFFAQSALSLYQPRASEQVCASDAHIKGVLRTHLRQYWKRKQTGREREGDAIRQMRSDCIRNRKIFHEKNFVVHLSHECI